MTLHDPAGGSTATDDPTVALNTGAPSHTATYSGEPNGGRSAYGRGSGAPAANDATAPGMLASQGEPGRRDDSEPTTESDDGDANPTGPVTPAPALPRDGEPNLGGDSQSRRPAWATTADNAGIEPGDGNHSGKSFPGAPQEPPVDYDGGGSGGD